MSDPRMHPIPDGAKAHILQIPHGSDVIAALAAYARDHQCGIAVLDVTGYVVGRVSFCDAGPFFKMPFQILSLKGTIFPANVPTPMSGFTLSVAGIGGTMIGGPVTGPLIASGPVMVTAYGFTTAPNVRLPPV